MNQEEIIKIALHQSALDLNCQAHDFLKKEDVIVLSKPNPQARRYLKLPFYCQLVTYGHNVVASVHKDFQAEVKQYLKAHPRYQAFETPYLLELNQLLNTKGMQVYFMAEYFLPDLEVLKPLPCPYPTKILHPEDFEDLYTSDWSNALCQDRRHLDILGIGAYDKDRLIGLAACSMDCEEMWQIGVDVLADYRHQGIASSLTSILALEIIKYGKVPFYCCAWSNIASKRNANHVGFRTAWTEITAQPMKKTS